MADQPQAIFTTSLLDTTGQPNVVIDSPECHQLIWNLVNNATKAEDALLVTPFNSGSVGPNQKNFFFEFQPGVLSDVPTLQGWDLAVERDQSDAIKFLYIALSGNTSLSIAPGGNQTTSLFYTRAVQEDANSSRIKVFLHTGENIKLGGGAVPAGTRYGPFPLTLVQANAPTLSAPPITVDFVGRRTVLNDHKTANKFTFALTNMTQADLPLKPQVGADDTGATKLTVWFDAAPNESKESFPWALARVQDLSSKDVALVPTPPSSDWEITPQDATARGDIAVGPEWEITVTTPLALKPQEPVLFTFSGILTDLDPGITRMYLRFENLSVFPTSVLIAELEKTPLSYGATRGQGLYLSAGIPDKIPVLNYDSGLHIDQFGSGPAAVFNGGSVGIGTDTPQAKLHIHDDYQPADHGTLILGPGDLSQGVSLRFGCQPKYSWIQGQGNEPLAINPIGNNVGIGTATPGSRLSVAGGMAIGKSYAQESTLIADNNLAVEGKVGVGTTEPGSDLSVAGGVAIGKSYSQKNTTMAENYLAVEGRIGVGTTEPEYPLHVKSANGIRLSLEKSGGGQLFISNSNNDNSVQLVATGHDDNPNKHTSANMLYLGGWASPNPGLPKMVLNANEVDVQSTTTAFSGRVGIGAPADSQAALLVNGDTSVSGSVLTGAAKLPASCGVEKLRIIRGVIWQVDTSNGLKYKVNGSGFTVKTDGRAGVWQINFDKVFSDMPAVVATPQFFGDESSSRIYNTIFVTYTSAWSITIRTGDVYYGNPNWGDFGFIVIGPV